MQKLYNNISLAYKAKKLIIGQEDVIRSMRSSKKTIVFIDFRASINTFKLIQNKANYFDVNLIVLNDINGNLDKIFKGKQIRVMAIKDKGFRNLISKNIKE